MTMRGRRTQLLLLVGVLGVVAVGFLLSSAQAPRTLPATGIRNLEEAVSVGVLDQTVLDDLRDDGEALGFVSIDLTELIARLERTFPELAQQVGRIERIDKIDEALATAKEELNRLLGDRASVVSLYDGVPVVSYRFLSEAVLLQALQLPLVSSIRADDLGQAHVVESAALVRAPEVHDAGFTGQDTYVAVLDSGVDPTGNTKFFPQGSIATAETYRAKDPDDGDADGTATPYGHGTHVASTVLAIAPGTRVISVEVFTWLTENPEPYYSRGRVVDGLRYVVALKKQYLADPTKCCNIVALNFSAGRSRTYNETDCSDDFGFRSALEVQIVPVLSSGNSAIEKTTADPDGHFRAGIGYPGCSPFAFSVGATTDGAFEQVRGVRNGKLVGLCEASAGVDRLTTFSQTGGPLDMLAPGNCIVAATGALQGTSMAAPHVAGAVAVLSSAKRGAGAAELMAALKDHGQPIEDTRTTPSTMRNRLDMVDALAALTGAIDPQATVPPFTVGRGVAVEPHRISSQDVLRPGEPHQLQRFGIWNSGLATARYKLELAPSELQLSKVAPAAWFQVDPGSVTLGPGEALLIQPTVIVPSDAAPGSYAAVIRAVDAEVNGGPSDGVIVTFDVGSDRTESGLMGPILVLVAVTLVFLVGLALRRRLAS